MKLLKGLYHIVGGLIGVLLILASPICIFGVIWNLMDHTVDASMGEKIGAAVVGIVMAVLFWWCGRKLMGPKPENERTAHRRRERMLSGNLRLSWDKYVRRYAADDTATLQQAVKQMHHADQEEELRICYETARECLQLLGMAENGGASVGMAYDMQMLEDEKTVAINELLFRISTRAVQEAHAAPTDGEKQEWIRWGIQRMEEIYRKESLYIDQDMFQKGMELLNRAAEIDYRPY